MLFIITIWCKSCWKFLKWYLIIGCDNKIVKKQIIKNLRKKQRKKKFVNKNLSKKLYIIRKRNKQKEITTVNHDHCRTNHGSKKLRSSCKLTVTLKRALFEIKIEWNHKRKEPKGQIISRTFWYPRILPKNEWTNLFFVPVGQKNEFVRSFFGRIRGCQKLFRNYLTFKSSFLFHEKLKKYVSLIDLTFDTKNRATRPGIEPGINGLIIGRSTNWAITVLFVKMQY